MNECEIMQDFFAANPLTFARFISIVCHQLSHIGMSARETFLNKNKIATDSFLEIGLKAFGGRPLQVFIYPSGKMLRHSFRGIAICSTRGMRWHSTMCD